MLATFNGAWDWTAVGTLTLAVATFISLFLARKALMQTQQQLKLGQAQLAQTQREIELSRQEVEEAHRPVLVPVTNEREMDLGSLGSYPRSPAVIGEALMVPMKNIGSGPALSVEAAVLFFEVEGRTETLADSRRQSRKVTGVEVGAIVPLWFDGVGQASQVCFEIEIRYFSVSGRQWSTKASYFGERRVYDHIALLAAT